MDMSFADQALSLEYLVKNHTIAGEEGLSRFRKNSTSALPS